MALKLEQYTLTQSKMIHDCHTERGISNQNALFMSATFQQLVSLSTFPSNSTIFNIFWEPCETNLNLN